MRKRIRCIDYTPGVCCGVDEILPAIEVLGTAAGESSPSWAGPLIGAVGGAIGGAGAGLATGAGGFNSVTGTYTQPGQTPAGAPTGLNPATTASAGPGGTATTPNVATSASAGPGGTPAAPAAPSSGPGLFQNAVKAIGPALAGSVVSTGLQAAFGGRRGVTVPPPPGAAQIDPEGAQAAAQIRARQAVAGGLSSTNIAGANSQAGYAAATSGPTSGGKTALGQ